MLFFECAVTHFHTTSHGDTYPLSPYLRQDKSREEHNYAFPYPFFAVVSGISRRSFPKQHISNVFLVVYDEGRSPTQVFSSRLIEFSSLFGCVSLPVYVSCRPRSRVLVYPLSLYFALSWVNARSNAHNKPLRGRPDNSNERRNQYEP